MSILQRRELEDSPLADLHAIASELGIEGYRALRREDLVGAILQAQGGDGEPGAGADDVGVEPGEVEPGEEASGSEPAPAGLEPHPDAKPYRAAVPQSDGEPPAEGEPQSEVEPHPDAKPYRGPEPGSEAEPERETPLESDVGDEPDEAEPEPGPDAGSDDEAAATGPLDILSNGSGFIRVDGAGQSGEDVYVSPAQIRRCELRAGDEVTGPVRPPRRSERHPSLVRVSTVNGRDAEPPEERPEFSDLAPVHPTERLQGPPALDAVPFGKGSRVAIAGRAGAGATRLLQEIARTLAGGEVPVTVVLVGSRPEEVTEWQREEGPAVVGGSFDRPLEPQIQAAELAVERGKRTVERGGDAIVIIDSLEQVPSGPARRIFGAARNVEGGGSLTVIAAVGSAYEPLRQASTRITLDDGAESLTVVRPLSGTQRADLLG